MWLFSAAYLQKNFLFLIGNFKDFSWLKLWMLLKKQEDNYDLSYTICAVTL
jgi:hypothetical protein